MMHKKVYVDFARMIRSQRHALEHMRTMPDMSESFTDGYSVAIFNMTNKLVELFQNDNPQFNAEKFMQTCEIDTESK